MVVSVYDICKVYIISYFDDEPWKKIDEAVEKLASEHPGEKIELDFQSIQLMEPWKNKIFRTFMAKRLANIIVYNESLANYIKTMCIAGGMGTDRVKLIKIEAPRVKTAAELTIERIANEWQDIFEVDENNPNTVYIRIHKKIGQMTSDDVIEYIKESTKMFLKNHEANKLVLDTQNLYVGQYCTNALGKLCAEYENDGIEFIVKNNKEKVENNCKIAAALARQGEFTPARKMAEFNKRVKVNQVGLLMAYTKTRSTDIMGRSGNGEIKSCQPAIFLGATKVNNTYNLKFRVYVLDKFYTRVQWAIENDGAINKLVYHEIEVPIDSCGLNGIFLGREYHFNQPIQYHNGKEGGSMELMEMDENNHSTARLVTIPTFIKKVLDDHGVEYDEENLKLCIAKTHAIIKRNDGVCEDE